MLSDAIKGNVKTMVRPVRVSYFDPRTGEPCDSRPEPLRREKMRETVEERNAAIAKRERDEREAREISEAMRKRAGLKPTKPRKKRPTAAPRLLTCPVCGTRFETSKTRRITCSDECAKKRRAEKAKARYAAKVVRTARECAVCGRSFEVPGKVPKAHVLRGLREGAKAGARARVEGGDEGLIGRAHTDGFSANRSAIAGQHVRIKPNTC